MTGGKDNTRTQRSRSRRDRLRDSGYTFTQIELSPLAQSAMACLRADKKESQSQVIERAILALYQNRS